MTIVRKTKREKPTASRQTVVEKNIISNLMVENEIYHSVDEPETADNKYLRTISNKAGESIIVDVYDVLEAFQVTCPALQHLSKKALCAGLRGHKSAAEDLVDIWNSAERAIQLNGNRG